MCVLKGSVLVKEHNGGSSAEWTVETYVRKVAFMHRPLPASLLFAKKVYIGIRGIVRGKSKQKAGEMVPAMF